MRRYFYFLLSVCILFSVSCTYKQSKTNEAPTTKDSKSAIQAKDALQKQLEKDFKIGTKANNTKVIYDKDSICIINFDLIYTFASGRIETMKYEYVYSLNREENRVKGYFINLDEEPPMIEQAKRECDELELSLSPEERKNMGSWEVSLRYAVMFRLLNLEIKAIEEDYQ